MPAGIVADPDDPWVTPEADAVDGAASWLGCGLAIDEWDRRGFVTAGGGRI